MPAMKRTSSIFSISPAKPKYAKRTKTSRIPRPVNFHTGRVIPSATTLAHAAGPYKNKKFVTFEYLNQLTVIPGAANLLTASVLCNSLFDFDKNGCFGNKQPLYYDTMCSSTGPYKQYKVISWTTTYTLVNASSSNPVTIWAIPPVAAASEIDAAAEADNFPGVKCLYLTPQSGSKSYGTISVTGNIADVYASYDKDNGLIGNFNSDPVLTCYGGLVVQGSDGTSSPTVYVAVRHMAYAELTTVDSLVS